MGNIITLQSFSLPYKAHILKAKLESAGIPAMLADENITVLYGSSFSNVRVMIDEDDLEKATQLLESEEFISDKKLVVFDLDGTLIDSLEDLADSANHVLDNHGFATHPILDYRYFVGDGVRKLIERILPENHRTESEIERCKSEFVEYYNIHKEDKTTVYEDITELLVELKNRNIKIAVATNKVHEAVEPLMRKYFPQIHFDALIGQRDGVSVKPHPQIIYDILELTDCKQIETFHVGDTSTDIQLAKNANVESVGVTWGYRPESELLQSHADHIIHKPLELLNLL